MFPCLYSVPNKEKKKKRPIEPQVQEHQAFVCMQRVLFLPPTRTETAVGSRPRAVVTASVKCKTKQSEAAAQEFPLEHFFSGHMLKMCMT